MERKFGKEKNGEKTFGLINLYLSSSSKFLFPSELFIAYRLNGYFFSTLSYIDPTN